MPANPAELGVIRVAKPCHRDWDKMTGDQRARFCGDCQLTVYNLSEMSTEEARALIREKEGQLCVRFYQRTDGTVLTRDCPVGVAKRKRTVIVAAAAAGAALASAAGVAAFALLDSEPEPTGCALGDEATAVTAAPPTAAVPMANVPSDESWIEKRRRQLGGRERQLTMGKMQSIQVIKNSGK